VTGPKQSLCSNSTTCRHRTFCNTHRATIATNSTSTDHHHRASSREGVDPDQSWSWVTFSKPNPTQPKISGPNPQKSPPDPTQPIIDTWYGILGYTENFIQQQYCYTSQTSSQSMTVIIQLQYSLADSRVFRNVKNITQSRLHPTQPTKN